jgi:effector-binding domain-containing protein
MVRMFTRKWHLLVGFPVAVPVAGADGLMGSVLPGGKYIRSVHRGPYQDVARTYREIVAWARAEEIRIGAESIEVYVNDPRQVKKEDIETIILIPVAE